MNNVFKLTICTLFLAGLGVFFFVGCSGDSSTSPGESLTFTYDNIWPPIEGNSWEFSLHNQIFETEGDLYSTPEEIPGLPTMESLYADIQNDDWGAPTSVARGNWSLLFSDNGSEIEGTTVLAVSNTTEMLEGIPRRPYPFWVGQSWTHSGDQISFSSAEVTVWVLLQGGLTPGNSFSAELPSWGRTMYLNSLIGPIRSINVMDQEYSNCLECFYVLDGGIQTVVNEIEEIEGYFRQYFYGIIVYAPDVGPVFCQERYMGGPGHWENRKATLQAFGNN